MYNRYIRSDSGVYTRIPEEEPVPQEPPAPPVQSGGTAGPQAAPPREDPRQSPFQPSAGRSFSGGLSDTLRRTLDQLHLDRIDSGDLLLLGLLFFLFREGADEELLIALGLLLIL